MRSLEECVADVLPVVRQEARTADRDASFPIEGLAALRHSGLLGLLVPLGYGGLGGGLSDLARIAAELADECLSTAMIWAMHCQQVAALVAGCRSPLREDLLPRIARGEVYVASVTSEKGTGGHLLTSESPLQRADKRLILHREAPIVTGAIHADGFLVTMRDHRSARAEEVSLVYADRADLKVQPANGSWNPMGMRATHSVACRLDGELPESNVIGEPGRFRTIAVSSFIPTGHIAWAASWLGAARGALRAVIGLLRSPQGHKQFDIHSELLRTRLARARLDLDTVAAMLHQVIRDVDAEDPEANPVQLRLNGLKVFAAERTFSVVDTLVDLVGLRHGYQKDSPLPLERLFRDLRSASLNYSNDRLLSVNGALALLDSDVTLAW